MRYLGVVLALAAGASFALASSSCGRPTPVWGELTPAHTVRYYAPMSLPAVAPDGTLWVVNGTKLLHFTPDGQQLGESELPGEFVQGVEPRALRSALYSAAEAGVFVALSNGRVGLVTEAGELAWVRQFSSYGVGDRPHPDGLLVYCDGTGGWGYSLVDTQGNVRWRVPGWVSGRGRAVDEMGRTWFLAGSRLQVVARDGSHLLEKQLEGEEPGQQLCGAVGDRVLIRSIRHVFCMDVQGQVLWNLEVDGEQRYILTSMLVSATRSVFEILRSGQSPPYYYGLLLVDGSGEQLREFQSPPGALIYSDPEHFLSSSSVLTCYTADGVELWTYTMPLPYQQGTIHRGDVIPEYTSSGPVTGTDGRIYFEEDSTLYALDMQGHLLWEKAGTVFYDELVEDKWWGGDFFY